MLNRFINNINTHAIEEYPNAKSFTIHNTVHFFSHSPHADIFIYNLIEKCVWKSYSDYNYQTEYNIEFKEKGIYSVKVIQNNHNYTKRILIY